MASDSVAQQRRLTGLLLDAIGAVDFALAGSGAIREHGLTDRPTQDVDLFSSSSTTEDEFAAALERSVQQLEEQGYQVTRVRSAPLFARFVVEKPGGDAVAVDLGVDWRQHPPVQLDVGRVLSLPDAVASKVSAVYSRGEDRDFLDLDAIRESGRFTDTEVLQLARDHDGGFDVATFADLLRGVSRLDPGRTIDYGIDAPGLARIKQRLIAWADQLQNVEPNGPDDDTKLERPPLRRPDGPTLPPPDSFSRRPPSPPNGPTPPSL